MNLSEYCSLSPDTFRGRLTLSGLAGLVLALCFPPYYQWYLIPVPFVLIHLVMSRVDPLEAARHGAVFAVVFYLFHTYWFASFHFLALPFMLAWLGFVHAVWAGGITWWGWNVWSGTAGWVLMQWFLGVGYHAFPWSRLATALAVTPSLIQPVRFTGELVLGGTIVLASFMVGEWLTNRRLLIPLVLIVCVGVLLVGEGYVRYHYEQVDLSSRRTMLVQPNVASGEAPEDPYRQLRRLVEMTETKAQPGDLVVWPETAVLREPFTIDGNGLMWRTLRWRNFFKDLMAPGFSLFFGLQFTDPQPNRLDRLNGAVLLDQEINPAGFYTKRRPVPGGEHLPFMGQVEWIKQFGRMVGTLGYRAGEKGGLIPVEVGGQTRRIGVQICFEDAFSQHVRDQVNRGADLLINISNDSWSNSTASHWQHFYRARIRAIETGRPVLRNGNTGVSAIIDPIGRLTGTLEPYREGTVRGRIPDPMDRPLFTRWGSWLTAGLLIVMLLTGWNFSRIRQ
jgi:apolipoprotein N-acyltransferase